MRVKILSFSHKNLKKKRPTGKKKSSVSQKDKEEMLTKLEVSVLPHCYTIINSFLFAWVDKYGASYCHVLVVQPVKVF